MINVEDLEKIYNGVAEGIDLTTKQLHEYGFNSADINKLIEDNIIERVKRGHYSLKDIDELYDYGVRLAKGNNYDLANRTFLKCFELEPNNYKYCLQLFTVCIHEKEYDKAFKLYDRLYKLSNDNEKIDLRYYMYLLNYITDIPSKYKDMVEGTNYYSIKIPSDDKRYSDVMSYNRARSTAIKGKFSSAWRILYAITIKNRGYTLQDIAEKNLLTQTITEEKKSRKVVNSLVSEKKYDAVIDYLENKRKKHKLNTIEEYIIKLSESYLIIKNSSTIPIEKNIDTDNLFEAIQANKFDLALKINNEFNKEREIANEDNTLNIILTDICKLINSLKKSNTNKKPDIVEEQKKEVKSDNNFMSLVSSLMSNDIDSAFKYLECYLLEIGKSEYGYIITNLIKLSILEKDIAYTAPMLELSLMNSNNYQFNINNYIQKFYLCLSSERLDEAEIYLNIISSATKINNENLSIDNLYKVLETHKSKTNYQNNTPILESNNQVQESNNTYEEEFDDDEDEAVFDSDLPKNNEDIIREQSDIKFIEKKHNELIKNKGIIILNSMSKERTNFILNEADKYLDMSVFTIVDGGKTRIVLRYNELDYEDFDITALITEAMDDYRNGFYEDSLNKQIKILETNAENKSSNYAMIGLSYMRLFDIDKAIEYLTVANYLAKEEKSTRDFGDLILKLKGEIDEEDIKPNVKMQQKDFRNDNDKFYGIKNFEELNTYICESGLDVESACRSLNMSEEDIDVVKLIYAREYYTLGNKEKGELFLKSYEKSKAKTNKTKSIYKYLQQNKKFYKNRFDGEPRQLSLKLVPKK